MLDVAVLALDPLYLDGVARRPRGASSLTELFGGASQLAGVDR